MNMDKHSIQKKVYYHDTDAEGVVYYGNYLKYFEEGRAEFFQGKGLSLKAFAEKGILFVVKKVEINYKNPAKYDDCIEVFTSVEKQKKASIVFIQDVCKDGLILAEGIVKVACVNEKFEPVQIPSEVSL